MNKINTIDSDILLKEQLKNREFRDEYNALEKEW